MDASPLRQRPGRSAYWWLAAIPVLVHAALLLLHSVNAPRLDDFSDGLVLLPQFYGTDSLWEKCRILFSMYQNHRWGLLHGIYFAYHCIDFRSANLLSFIPLLALPWLWFRLFRHEPYAPALLAIATTLVFNLQAWTGLFWITASLAAIPVIPLALLTCMLATRGDWRSLAVAAGTAAIATFTNGNGVTLWPLVLAWLLYEVFTGRKTAVARSSVWLLCSAMFVVLYFSRTILDHEIPGTNNMPDAAAKILANPVLFLQGLLAMIGSIAMYHPDNMQYKLPLAVFIGASEVLALAWLLWRGALRRYPAIILLALFLLGTTTAIAATRVVFMGIEQAFQGHYKLYNGTFLLIVVTAWLDYRKNIPSRTMLPAAITASFALYCFSLWFFYPTLHQYHEELASDTRNWLHTHALQRAESRYLVKKPNQKLETAVAGGFYDPWTLVPEQHKPHETEVLGRCESTGEPLPAVAESRRNARAVHVQLALAEALPSLVVCSPLQAIQFSLYDTHYANKNGTYSAELWVPRNPDMKDDEGPWQVYLSR